jgi:hypothetical protein
MMSAFAGLLGRRARWREPVAGLTPEKQRLLERARRTARLMDAQFSVAGFRFGLEAMIGLVPGLGDLVSAGASLYLLSAAKRLGVPRSRQLQISALIVADLLIGLVPFLGDAADAVFKAHMRSLAIIENDLGVRGERVDGTVVRR